MHPADHAADHTADAVEHTAAGEHAPHTPMPPVGGKLLPTVGKNLYAGGRSLPSGRYWARGLFWGVLTLALAFALRMPVL